MKKLLALLLSALLLASLAACSDEDEAPEDLKNYLQQEIVVDREEIDGAVFHFVSVDSETVAVSKYDGPDAPHKVTIPEKLNGKAVVSIADEAFYYCSNVSELVLPETLTSIGKYAFAGCTELTSVTLPASLETLGEGAFLRCSALESISFAEGSVLTEIAKNAFLECTKLSAVKLPANIKTVGEAAFFGCSAVSEIELAEGVETVGKQAFQKCAALAKLTLPASLTEIGDFAFSGSENLYIDFVTCPADSVAETYVNGMDLPELPAVG